MSDHSHGGPPQQPEPEPSVIVNLLAHSASNVISGVVTAPLYYPISRAGALLKVDGLIAAHGLGAPARPYASFADVIFQTNDGLGFTANYRGLGWTLVSRGAIQPVRNLAASCVQQKVGRLLPRYDEATDYWKASAVDHVVSVIADAVCQPLVLLETLPLTLAQADVRPAGQHLGGFGHLSAILAGLAAGTGALQFTALRVFALECLRIVVHRTAFAAARTCTRVLNPYKDDDTPAADLPKLIEAQAAMTFVQAVTYPISVIAARVIIANAAAPVGELRRGIYDCAMEGGLYRGFGVQVATGLASTLVLVGWQGL